MPEYRFQCIAWVQVWAQGKTQDEARIIAEDKLARLNFADVKLSYEPLDYVPEK